VILCVNPPDCHFNIGHGGVSWVHHRTFADKDLPWLYHGSLLQRKRGRIKRLRREY
jgi:hypothetical protein